MLQLNPPIPLETPYGKGLAHFIIDYSPEFDLLWVVFLDETKECWTFNNKDIKAQTNYTLGRVENFKRRQTSVKEKLIGIQQ